MNVWSVIVLLLALAPGARAAVLWHEDFGAYTGAGLAPGGGAGHLDSDHWVVFGASSGDTAFGDRRSGGDFGRGRSRGGVGAGGLYAFDVPDGTGGTHPALGLQPTGADYSPALLVLEIPNDTGRALDRLGLGFELWARNDGDRATRIDLGIGVSGPSGVRLGPAIELTTPGPRDPSPRWRPWLRELLADDLVAAPGELLQVYWYLSDAGGGGSRDEVALGHLTLSGESAGGAPAPAAAAEPPALGMAALAGLLLAARRRG